jgi:ParB family chromosome partitioning protein
MTNKTTKNRGLGRGLSALMADVAQPADTADTNPSRRPDLLVPIETVEPNPDQPRRTFDEESLSDLTASVREKGIIQPLIVRRKPGSETQYEIVAGERRWRAAQRAQLHEIPVLLREFSDAEVLEVAMIENIQRADLNAIDEAAGYRQLMERFGHTQEELGTALGKSRSHIANLMRLLTLPDTIQTYVSDGRLSAGHARSLIGQENALDLANKVVRDGLSVRDIEKLVRKGSASTKRHAPARSSKDADTIQIERELGAALGMGVHIDQNTTGEAGKLTLNYKSLAQLDDLLRVLSGG